MNLRINFLIIGFILIIIKMNINSDLVFCENSIIANHNSVAEFENISEGLLPYTIPIRLMFQHASVGGTIDDGLDCIQGTRNNPEECDDYPDYKYDRRNWEFQPRGNSGWYGKINDFINGVESQKDKFDIFSFKYCYLDGIDGLQEPCGSIYDKQKVEKAWTSLRDSMETLEKRYPEKKFIWWTIPLTQVGMFCTDTLNLLIRNHAITHGKYLFDIADIEAYDTLNNHVLNQNGWEMAFKPYCGEQQPGATNCHPNWLGKIRLAKAFWWMMTKIAEKDFTGNEEYNSDSNVIYIRFDSGTLRIKFNEINGKIKLLNIYDIMGQRLYFNKTFDTGSVNELNINCEQYINGLYLITFSDRMNFYTHKFIISD